MARMRKRHVQIEMTYAPVRGGKRQGAGRPPKGYRSSERHETRARFERWKPVHVTLRLVSRYGTLRRRDTYFAIRNATKAVLGRANFRVVHLSPEKDHIHMLVEAQTNAALSSGMQAFQISAAQHLNRALSKRTGRRRRGTVFADRYHAHILQSPTETRNALNYVLNNWRHHDEDEATVDARDWDIDYMSSAISFIDWKERDRVRLINIDPEQRLCVTRPHTWLLRKGWQRAGTISMYAVPGARH